MVLHAFMKRSIHAYFCALSAGKFKPNCIRYQRFFSHEFEIVGTLRNKQVAQDSDPTSHIKPRDCTTLKYFSWQFCHVRLSAGLELDLIFRHPVFAWDILSFVLAFCLLMLLILCVVLCIFGFMVRDAILATCAHSPMKAKCPHSTSSPLIRGAKGWN